jgi:hypothetical protein
VKTRITAIAAVLGLLLVATPAGAHGQRGAFGLFGDFGGLDFGGLGFGDHFGGFGRFGFGDFGGFGRFGLGFGLGLGSSTADRLQTRFTDQFDSLKTQYDTGLAGSTDFFTTDTYTNIVNKTQRLDDRYSAFVDSVQNTIDRIPDLVSLANDNITFYNNLLADYQADTSISAAKLDRIELVINHITDRLNSRIDSLDSTLSTLQTNLTTYQSTETDISTFLSDIQAAGSGTSGGSTTSTVDTLMAASNVASPVMVSDVAASLSPDTSLSTGSVPEPTSILLLLLGLGASSIFAIRQRPRGN